MFYLASTAQDIPSLGVKSIVIDDDFTDCGPTFEQNVPLFEGLC
ncbi:hypothetical protein VITU9109_17428 [Vibrio tubiashii ATCC 19109]|uniref:Uncharacterized protein n=1 Tax=Vibrio tubiashii ATCC 19109 TaxID=1051646 RepID=A0ABP2LMN6_9VIBR|nr:hypothetical protein VITU9109_17428 [Vibrio tubiashii ATCC 19109]